MLRFVFCTTCYKLSKHESVPVSHECVLCYSDSGVRGGGTAGKEASVVAQVRAYGGLTILVLGMEEEQFSKWAGRHSLSKG